MVPKQPARAGRLVRPFNTQFAAVAVSLGFTAGDSTAMGKDNAMVQSIASIAVQVESYADAMRQFRLILTEGNIGEPTPGFPALPVYVAADSVDTGIFERLDNLVKRIRVAPNYTNETGALLGIIPSASSDLAPEDMQPKLKVVSMPGSIVRVSFVRGSTDGVELETKVDNSDKWESAGRYFKSPANLVIPSNPLNLPRAVQTRARYVGGNTPIGQFSPIVSTATQPDA